MAKHICMVTDAVVIVGDLVDGPVKQLEESSRSLANIMSRYGTYYVTGWFISNIICVIVSVTEREKERERGEREYGDTN